MNRHSRFNGIGMEALLKWLFTLLLLSVILLILGGQLDRQYENRLSEIKKQSAWVQSQAPLFSKDTVQLLLIPQLGNYWIRNEEPVAGELVLRSIDGGRWYFILNTRYIMAELAEQERFLLVLGLLGLLASVEVAVFLAYALARPLQRLGWACMEIAHGHRVVLPVSWWFPRELRELMLSFNRMSSQLERWKDVQRQVEWMDRLATIGEMASGLSHEIRNPLASMRVHIELLKRQSHTEQETSDLAVLETELERLNQVVGDLLSFVRPGASVHVAVQMQEILDWCRNMVYSQCERQHVVWLQEETASPCFPVSADRGQMQQVVLNLVLNALQAMPQGGEIRVGVESFEEYGLLYVQDNGPGIPKETQERIFVPFFTTKKEGTGLGLFIVQRIINNHRGKISFTSSVAGGTTFQILIPRFIDPASDS